MAIKKGKDLGMVWQCTCSKWNFEDAKACWKCHLPKDSDAPKKRGRPKKEAINALP